MTSVIGPSAPNQPNASTTPSAATTSSPTNFTSGAVPAQHPAAKSYAHATKTATNIPPAAAGASANNAKSGDASINGANTMAQGGSQAANNGTTPNGNVDHGRKPSVVISASGTTYTNTPNGAPVVQNGRPAINFGSMNAQGSPLPQPSAPYQQQSSLPTPSRDARVISPTSSPSPIPHPPPSGGRPPSSLQGQGNGLTFGSAGPESDMRQGHMPVPGGPGMGSMHERRTSSQSMHSESNMGRNFTPAGRGRGYPPQPFGAQSPAQGYRQPVNQSRPGSNVPAHFQPPNTPYARGRGSPAPQMPPQPHMGGNSQMQQYGGYPPQHMPPQQVFLPFPCIFSLGSWAPVVPFTIVFVVSLPPAKDTTFYRSPSPSTHISKQFP
nr:hypothetical protein CFP56_63053 [Quercus suber]